MAVEPEKISLELLDKLIGGLVGDVAEIKAMQVRDQAAIENMDTTLAPHACRCGRRQGDWQRGRGQAHSNRTPYGHDE